MRYRFQRYVNGSLFGYNLNELFATRLGFNRGEMIMCVPTDWRQLESSRLIQSLSQWMVMIISHVFFKGNAAIRKIIEDEAFL